MDRHTEITVGLSQDEAFELLERCVSHDEDDNIVFQSALRKLADAIKFGRAIAV